VVARTIPMPSKEELPEGPRRTFVTELRRYYRAAGRPPLREISRTIERHSAPEISRITASAETIRRMITGKVLPVERDRVRAVFRVLCELGEIDPDASRWAEYDRYEEPETNWQYVERLWDTALEEEADAPPFPRPAPPPPKPAPRIGLPTDDPWAAGGTGYSNEPPF
jgi:hypothetical protein